VPPGPEAIAFRSISAQRYSNGGSGLASIHTPIPAFLVLPSAEDESGVSSAG
jgi:hypothetical protein